MDDNADDAVLVAAVAEDYVRRLGRDAVPHLRRRQATAQGQADTKAWCDIADAAALILKAG